jgi:hypothetical protein
MSEFISKLTNFIAIALLLSGMGLIAVKFLKPHLFKNQDIVLIVAFFLTSGLLIWFGGDYSISFKKEPQFTLAFLALPAVFYSFEMLKIRASKK